MTHDVFLSHSSKDHEIAEKMCSVLEERGLKCWIAPRDIVPGASWGGAIVEAIRDCGCMVLILSEESNKSGQVLREVERAVNKTKPVIPFRISNVTPSESMEYFISSSHWMDAQSSPLSQSLDQLANLLTSLLRSRELESTGHHGDSELPDEPIIAPEGTAGRMVRIVIGCCLALLVVFVGWLTIISNEDEQQVSDEPAVSDGVVAQHTGVKEQTASVNNGNRFEPATGPTSPATDLNTLRPDNNDQGQPLRSDFSLSVDIKGEAIVDKNGLVQFVEAQKFIVEIVADRECYLGVWYIDDLGAVVQLFPNEHEPDHHIPAGKPRRIPGEDSYAIEATISRTTERLHVVASTKRWNPVTGETIGPYAVFSGTKKKEWQSQMRGLTIVNPNQSNEVAEKIIPFRVVATPP